MADKLTKKKSVNEDQNEQQQDDRNQELNAIDEVQVFMVTLKFIVGDASGDKARRDTIQSITMAHDIDSIITTSLKGSITVWTKQVDH